MEPLLRVINLSKSFGTLPALQQVSFEVYPGQVVGLAGRSGAGKSVVAMLLAGLLLPNEGDLYFGGQRLESPFDAGKLGIEIIHQEPTLAENLDITGNIFLGREIGWPSFIKWFMVPNQRRMDEEATRILSQLDISFASLREKVRNLSSEQRQLVSIARAMVRPAKLVVVDEPTLLLSYPYQQKLLSLIQSWQREGVAVLFSSNNLEHLFAVTDRIIALRHGRKVADQRTDETSREEIVSVLVDTQERQQLTPAIWALDSYYSAREQAQKLRYNQTLLEKDLAAQDTLNQQLIEQLGEQVKALDEANLALQDAHRRLLTEREQERKHLARELHDQVIQDLLSENYRIEDICEREDVTPELKEDLVDVRETLQILVDELRRTCKNLRPPTIDSLGLGAALQSYTRDWAERTSTTLTLELDANLGRLPEEIELSIFRLVQEGLNNVRKHAQANNVRIALEHTSPRMLMITIADNGIGLPANFDLGTLAAQGHYGLLGISERVALMQGRLRMQNQNNSGLLLQVEIPHPRPQ
ncbi:MAG: ATP-binding cassette domain-containing protein [Ardenticatenaceae bacterium]